MQGWRKLAFLVVVLCFTSGFAQASTCGAMVQQAISIVQTGCAATARNQACYGYLSLQATPRAGVQNFTFTKEGDLANVADLDTLHLSPLDLADKTWGVALMKLQANLPDTLPGENVTFVLFGDVQVQNAVATSANQPTAQVTAKINSTIHSAPDDSYRSVGTLSAGDTATADGRNQDGTWLRLALPNSTSFGWIETSLVSSSADLTQLSVVDAAVAETDYTPMQAFYFKSGIGQTSCAQAPQDGLLVQTPAGAGKINFRVDDVDVQLGSTAYLQAQPGGLLIITIVEGQGEVTADGKTAIVPAGGQVSVPLDENLQAAGRPGDVQPYDPSLVQWLPIQLLPILITIAPPATQAQILAASLPSSSFVPNLSLLGVVGDLSSLTSLPEDQFCPQMDAALAQAGMSRQDYLDSLTHSLQGVTGSGQTQVSQMIQMLQACP